MNRDDIKQILLLYRPGTADADDPQIAEALALAKSDAELARWLEEHCGRQSALRAKFRQITPPAGLLEQINSEHAANARAVSWRRPLALALAAIIILGCASFLLLRSQASSENDLTQFRSRMVRMALTGYAMDLETNNMAPLRAYLAQRNAPSNYALSPKLQAATVTGCAVKKWQGANVSLICFRTGEPLAAGESSDLWLFVADRGALKNASPSKMPQLAKVNRLMTATWVQGDKLYLLGVAGDEETIRAYL